MITLREHQVKGRDALLKHKKYCLFFEVGTGKTFTALDAVLKLPKGRLLIVAPKRVLEKMWKKEKHYDLSKHIVTYDNYERIARDKYFTRNTYDYIILDEVHRIKGRTSKTSKKIRAISDRASHVFGLTGTPVANNYDDIYNIYRNMTINEFDMSYEQFINTYYYTKNLQSSMGFPFQILLGVRPYNKDELLERIGKHCMVVKSEDVLDLPGERIIKTYVTGMVSEKYKEIGNGILILPDYSKTMTKLESEQKLRQAANGFVYDFYKNPIQIADNKKLKELNFILVDLLEETEKVIIVYYYQEDLRRLKELKYRWTMDTEEFENTDSQILFLQYQQCEGLNLQFCNQIIFYSYDYSFLNFEQLCGRIHRQGQRHKVTYNIMIAKGTIEETMWWAISNKKSRDEYLKEALK